MWPTHLVKSKTSAASDGVPPCTESSQAHHVGPRAMVGIPDEGGVGRKGREGGREMC